MDLKTYTAAHGAQTRLARRLKCNAQLVWQWANNVRPIPVVRCPGIELETAGAVPCEEQRPDVCWSRVPDASWPHPSGRPLIDVAAAQEARLAA